MGKLLAASALAACAAVLAPLAPVAATPAAPAAPASEAGAFISAINQIRASNGLPTLQTHGEIAGIAQSWAQHMAAAGAISHNGSLPNQVDAPWTALGENVGAGTDVDSLMQAFMNSSSHASNIVDPDYGYIGVGVVWGGDGRLYTCHVFMGMATAPPPPEPAAPGGSGGAGLSGGTKSAGAGPPAPAAEAAPPPPPQGPAEPARVVTVLAAVRSLDDRAPGPNSAAWRPLSRRTT